jgi:hypothetical protein
MTQTPPAPPALPPGVDIIWLFDQLFPLVAFVVVVLVGAFAVRWVFRTPVGEALAERLRLRARGRASSAGANTPELATLSTQVARLEEQVSELAERLDFAERVLAERRERQLGAGP